MLEHVIDKLAAADPRTVLRTGLIEVAQREQVSMDVLHADITTFSVEGAYDSKETADDILSLIYGYSTDNRTDLNQFLGVNPAGVFVIGDILKGKADAKSWNTSLLSELRDSINTDTPSIYVADSAAVTEDSLDEADVYEIDPISRLSRNYSAVNTLIDRAWEIDDWTQIGTLADTGDEDGAASYKLQSFHHSIHGHDLRCIIVHSRARLNAASNELDDTEEALYDAVDLLD